MTAALFGLFWAGTSPLPAVALFALSGAAVGGVIVSNQNRVMAVAPGSTDVASAWAGAAYNTGIAVGALLGGAIVPSLGVRATALVGGLRPHAAAR